MDPTRTPDPPPVGGAPQLAGPAAADETPLDAALRHAVTRGVLLAAFLVATGLLFQKLVTIVAAGVITIIFAMVFSAVAAPLARRGVPRPVGAFLGVLALVAVVGGLLAVVVPTLAGQLRDFAERLPTLVDDVAVFAGGEGAQGAGERFERAADRLVGDPSRLLGPLASVGMGVAGVLSALAVILITAYFMAARPEPLITGVLRLFPPDRREWAGCVFERLRLAWTGWMRGVLIDMAVTGALLWVGLTAIGLEYATLFAALSALLVVVPYFGAVIGGIPPVLLGFADSTELGLLAMGVYLVVQQLESNVIVPLVMARQVKLHPAVIAIGVVVVSQLFGLVGVLVAVPLSAAFVILVEEIWVRPLERRRGIVAPDVLAVDRGGDGRWRRLRRERLQREEDRLRGEARLRGEDPDAVPPVTELEDPPVPATARRFLLLLGAPVLALSLAVTTVITHVPAIVDVLPAPALAVAGALLALAGLVAFRRSESLRAAMRGRVPHLVAAGVPAAVALLLAPAAGSVLVLAVLAAVAYAAHSVYYVPGLAPDTFRDVGMGAGLAALGVGLALWRPVPFLLAGLVLALAALWLGVSERRSLTTTV